MGSQRVKHDWSNLAQCAQSYRDGYWQLGPEFRRSWVSPKYTFHYTSLWCPAKLSKCYLYTSEIWRKCEMGQGVDVDTEDKRARTFRTVNVRVVRVRAWYNCSPHVVAFVVPGNIVIVSHKHPLTQCCPSPCPPSPGLGILSWKMKPSCYANPPLFNAIGLNTNGYVSSQCKFCWPSSFPRLKDDKGRSRDCNWGLLRVKRDYTV